MSNVFVEKAKKKKLSRPALILIIGLCIIGIPILVFLIIIGVAFVTKGSPRNGSRFKDDLTTKITNADVSTVETDLNSISNIESVTVTCKEGQFKVFIDTDDNLSDEQVQTIVNQAYNKVTSTLPVATYFTKTDSAKMYDLEINVYTSAEATEIGSSNPRIYYYLHKNSAEEEYEIDNLGQAKNEEIARELEGLTTTSDESDSTEETTE